MVDCLLCESRHKSIFCSLENGELLELTQNKGCSIIRKKQNIFKEGFYPHGLYCLHSGKVKLYQMAENGREQIVRLAKAGDVLGYRALLSGEQYTSTAEAIEESTVCFIPKDAIMKLIEKNSSLALNIMRLLSGDLRKAESKITDLAQKPVKERMAEVLLVLKEIYGFEEDNQTIAVTLTREEISNIAGTATETSIRILAEFKDSGLIQFDGKKIKVPDLKKLLVAANVHD
ncbi:MAG: Crp/Fnr family transcriptional regulator [Bacteroidota bacterium]